MFELRHLQQFVALHEHGTVRAAARALGLSQPALSRSLKALEEEVGAPLFERTRPRVVPTPAGRLVLERAEDVLGAARRVQGDVDRYLGRETGELVAGIGTYPAESILPPALGAFMKRHPAVRVRVLVEVWTELLPRLANGRIELAVTSTDEIEGGRRPFDVHPLKKRKGVVFARAGHPLARKRRTTLADLRPYPMASPRLPAQVRKLLGRPSDPEIECNSISAIKAVVAASDAIGIVSPASLADDPDAWTILPPGRDRLAGSFGIVTRRGRTLSPAAESFIEAVMEADAAV
ncbi:MAG: LysR family transcriptional regulator [Myxococcota bacterium]